MVSYVEAYEYAKKNNTTVKKAVEELSKLGKKSSPKKIKED